MENWLDDFLRYITTYIIHITNKAKQLSDAIVEVLGSVSSLGCLLLLAETIIGGLI